MSKKSNDSQINILKNTVFQKKIPCIKKVSRLKYKKIKKK